MRGLAEKFGADPDAILAEGVLLNVEDGWVLMLPDPDSPTFYVYAESQEGDAARIMEQYIDLVKSLIDDQALLSSGDCTSGSGWVILRPWTMWCCMVPSTGRLPRTSRRSLRRI